ncbi:NUDIX hydrolase [Candidatus Nomurabacteria bacterium]|nr:NUDIX hydrolase [Candidatus Nomurabacteria bacterium]
MTTVTVPRIDTTAVGKRVVAALIIREKRLLLLRKPDHPDFLMLPGGGLMEDDEGGLVYALRRQLGEELGFSPQVLPAHLCAEVVDHGVDEKVIIHLHRLVVSQDAVFQTILGFTLNWLGAAEINQIRDRFTPATMSCIEYAIAGGLI